MAPLVGAGAAAVAAPPAVAAIEGLVAGAAGGAAGGLISIFATGSGSGSRVLATDGAGARFGAGVAGQPGKGWAAGDLAAG